MKRAIRWVVMFMLVFSIMLPMKERNYVDAADSLSISLSFKPYDFVVDPNRSVAYMTRLGSKIIYAVNYETGITQTLALPYPTEKLEMYKDKLYVTQQKMRHDSYSDSETGGIAIVDLKDFSFIEVISVDIDPYDIAIDENGYLYITSGSGQWTDIKSYSLETKELIDKRSIRQKSTIFYNQETSSMYTITSDSSPRDINVYQVSSGRFTSSYDSPYHGDYPLDTKASFSLDGSLLYNMSGEVFDTYSDLTHRFSLPYSYNDLAFSGKDSLMFAANKEYGGIDVFRIDSNEYYYSLKEDVDVLNMVFKNGLIMVYQNESQQYFLEYVTDYSPKMFAQNEAYSLNNKEYNSFYDTIKNVPNTSAFLFVYTQNFHMMDRNKIKLKDGNGKIIPITVKSNEGVLYIEPQYLYEATTYTFIFEQGALKSYFKKELSPSVTYTFKTAPSPITNLTATIDSLKAPLEYKIVANVEGGDTPQYKFSVQENGVWKVLKNYSSQSTFVWNPTKVGDYTFKVSVRNLESAAEFEKEVIVQQSVKVDSMPSMVLTPTVTTTTNKDVVITAKASSSIGIKTILLPDGKVINGSTATFTVTKNGTYTFKAQDFLGTISTKTIVVSNIDKVKPTITLNLNTTAPTNKTVMIMANVSEVGSGLKHVKLPDGIYVIGSLLAFKVEKNGTYTFEAEDKAGNKYTKSIQVTNIDKVKPGNPTVEKVTTKSTVIKGTAEKASTVYIKIGTKTYKTVTKTDGTYSLGIVKQRYGTSITLYAQDKAGNKSALVSTKVR